MSAAIEVLDAEGLEAVTLRAVARHLGAHLNTVSFQVGTKSQLIELMADAVFETVTLDDLPGDGRKRIKEILRRYRDALLSHRDGARLVAGTAVVEKNTLRLAEAVSSALLDAGASDGVTIRTFWALLYLTLGLTQEQQAGLSLDVNTFRTASDGEYPTLHSLGDSLITLPFDARFEYGIEALIDAAL
ncbi:MAG TPA: TetR/AcrR family transcriptional regulator C-terminal domain-containing protein [Cellulomonas sp.]